MKAEELRERCRDYLMTVHSYDVSASDALEALGYGDNGLNDEAEYTELSEQKVGEERKALEAVWKLRDLITYGGDVKEEHADEARALDDLMKYIDRTLQSKKKGEWGTNVRGNQTWRLKQYHPQPISEERIEAIVKEVTGMKNEHDTPFKLFQAVGSSSNCTHIYKKCLQVVELTLKELNK